MNSSAFIYAKFNIFFFMETHVHFDANKPLSKLFR